MANYNNLKTAIQAVIKANGNREITGDILQNALLSMINSLGAGYQFAGVATTATNPGSPDAKVFYIANGKGTYTNFGGINVTEDDVVVLYWDSSWHKVSTGIASNDKLTELEYFDDGDNTEVIKGIGYYIYSKEHDFSVPSKIKVELSNVVSYDVIVYLSKSASSQVDIKELAVIKAGDSAAEIYDVVSVEHKYVGVAVPSSYTETVSITVVSNTNDSFDNKIKMSEKKIEKINDSISKQGLIIADNTSKIGKINDSIEGKPQEEFEIRSGYTNEDGSYVNDAGANNYGTTSYIPCNPGDELTITLTLEEANDLMTWVCCKDVNGKALPDLFKYLHSTFTGTISTTKYIVPDNVYFVSFTFWRYNKGYTFTVINKSNAEGIKKKISNLEQEVDKIKNESQNLSAESTSLALGSRLIKSEIPSYWFDEVNSDNYEKVGTYLDEKIASVPKGKHFIWITDCHYQGDIENADNRKHSAAIIDYVRRKLNIKTILHGGDVMQERNTALAAAKDWIAFNDDFVGRLGSDFKQVCGDHDHNAKSGTNPEEAVFTFAFAQKMLTAYNTDNLVFDHIHDEQVKALGWSDKLMSEYYAYNKMHYYYDDASIGTRFIVLFTGWAKTTFDFMAQTIGNSFEDEEGKCLYPQMDFLYQALMTLPNGYNVVVCGHNVLKATPHSDETAYGGSLSEVTKPLFVGYWHIVANMLRAFMNKTTTSKPIPSVDWSRTDGTYPSKTYDYTKAPDAGIVFSLGGDVHSDMMCKSNPIANYFFDEPLNLPSGGSYTVGTQMLHIVSISDGADRGNYLSYPDKLPLAPPATSGTINEQAFDIFTLTDDAIRITRIGAGEDRVVYFG